MADADATALQRRFAETSVRTLQGQIAGQVLVRYLWAYVGGALAFGLYAYFQISSAQIFFAEGISRATSTGISVGLVVALTFILADELPLRLRGRVSAPARYVLAAIASFAAGIAVWISFSWFFLYYQPDTWENVTLGGAGLALAFLVPRMLRFPAWAAVVWAVISVFAPIYITWVNFMPPLVYTRPDQDIAPFGLLMALLIAVGAYAPRLWRETKALTHRRARLSG
ncbi:MAG: hypothetical protein IPK19_39085 [Chloroflexi bacterium]|nr:hypothetical protein [Chloroflexota bacterium]